MSPCIPKLGSRQM